MLYWTFQCSTDKIELPCHTPENLLERTRRFLYDDRETPQNLKNPLLGEIPIPCQFFRFSDTKIAIQTEVESILDHFRSEPTAIHIHPIFGPLDREPTINNMQGYIIRKFIRPSSNDTIKIQLPALNDTGPNPGTH
jgi:hypothetical protein